ncbi:MAG: dihydropteroate synthase [Gammaproteobacteria bacterium]|nr:dihydropteroate synthase [Pseudomonadales bacterium]MCP5347262.1 dihydropteroate synthase [Pseudomonadales bacterium]
MPRILDLGGRQLDLSTPVIMGVINVTPDSFSDGATLGDPRATGFRVSPQRALARAEAMVAAGAAIIDVGGESTRPGADPVSSDEQLQRVMPVIEAIHRNLDTAISIDTSSATVMREACQAGAQLINDVRALQQEGAMQAAAATGAAVCLMHSRGEPRTMQQEIHYTDVVAEILQFLKDRVAETISAGIPREKLVIDPGFGFGKTLEHNYRILRELDRFGDLGLPILVGVSRKSMIGKVVDRPADQRLAGSLAATVWALARGASIVRTHDVAETLDAIKVVCAIADDR